MSDSGSLLHPPPPHAALIASAGMGHLIPCLRLAAKLLHHHCLVTLITVQPTVSLAESQFISRFLSSFPQVTHKVFNLLPLDPAAAKSTDPFWLRYDAIRCSIHLLSPLLSLASPPLSAVITDLFLVSPVIPITENLNLPNYILFTSSARMFSLFAYLPTSDQLSGGLDIPGIPPIPKSSIPPLLLNPDSSFASIFFADSQKITKFDGVLINTFEGVEAEALDAINGNKIGLPPLIAIGPFLPCEFEKEESDALAQYLKWLDDQPARSVVYVSFGSRTAMSREQIREIGDGLLKSGCKFMWVVKDNVVDKEEEESLIEVVGEELMEKLKHKGLVVKDWVDQEGILGHKSVGGFVSHCGWNSVAEAAWHGVPMLAWPLHGDQKINAEVVERSGLGRWASSWGWGGETVVKAEEIGKRIKEVMENDEDLRVQAANIREKARKTVGVGGRSESNLKGLVEDWKKKSGSI